MSAFISIKTLMQIIASPIQREAYSVASGCNYLVVDLRAWDRENDAKLQSLVTAGFLPACVILGLGPEAHTHPLVDVMAVDEPELEQLMGVIKQHAVAAATLVQVLRHNERATVEQGLLAESLAYSTLQQSADFKHWLDQSNRPGAHAETDPPLLIERNGVTLILTLNRPSARNAYNTTLKDALCEALLLAHSDDTIKQLSLRGNGPAFSAGGDLSEFGSVQDAGLAHLSRTTRTAAALLSTLPHGSESRLHGACIGAGIELPAFTRDITAHPDTFFQLPEVAMGLIPGAGGTVSILKRCGRQRTALMALSNRRIDTHTALAWGLIDTLSD